MSPVRIYHSFLHKHGSGCSSSREEDENFKISDYFYNAFFHVYQNRDIWGLLDRSYLLSSWIGEAKTYISSRGSQLRYEGMRHLFWDLQYDYFL